MSQSLPTGGFRWVSIEPNEVSDLARCTDKGYLLEVDVSYPRDLHNSHNDLPFMCEKLKIGGVEKLVPNLKGKKNYVVHIRALDQALTNGLRLERIHRAIQYDQSAWMKPYIDFNTQLRTHTTNDLEKDFFKLMNNAMFGKTMDNIRKHRNIRLVTNKESYLRAVMQPNFKSGALFGENLMGCEMVPKYGENLTICYMDTDSLVYHIKTKDFYADITDDVEERFDMSGYDKEDARPCAGGMGA